MTHTHAQYLSMAQGPEDEVESEEVVVVEEEEEEEEVVEEDNDDDDDDDDDRELDAKAKSRIVAELLARKRRR